MSDDSGKKYDDLLFAVRRSIRYHNRRRKVFDFSHKLSTGITIFGGTAVFFSILSKAKDPWPLVFSAIIAIVAIFDLVINSPQAARFHHDLARKYFEIEKDMVKRYEDKESLLPEWTAKRLDIEAEEPPVLHVLNAICHNELCRAIGCDNDDLVKIGFFQRIFRHFFDIREHKLKRYRDITKDSEDKN